MTIDEMADRLQTEVANANLGATSMKFDLKTEGVIRVDGGQVSRTDAPASCTLRLTKSDLESIMAGEMDPRDAMMSGRMEVEGDVSVVMAMQPIIAKAWGPPA